MLQDNIYLPSQPCVLIQLSITPAATASDVTWNKSQWHVSLLLVTHIDRAMSWWRHQMKTFSALLAICAGNSPVPGEFPAQRPVTRSFYVFFDLRLNKRLRKQSWGWWFETLSRPLWRHRNVQWEYLPWAWQCYKLSKIIWGRISVVQFTAGNFRHGGAHSTSV